MAAIDWGNLYRATNKENTPTPGYLFNDIIQNVSSAKPSEIPTVAEYLADCVDGDHAHVKLKALFVIKALAYRIPPFQKCMLPRIASVQEAAAFTGPPSAMFGDEPYRLVREAAEGALEALTGGEFYHQEYQQLSQRIVGFGNYQPPEDTLLPDGSVNVGRDVSFGDVLGGAVGGVLSGAGAILGGVKELFTGNSRHVAGLELDSMGPCTDEDAGDFHDEDREPYDDPPDVEDDEEYHAPTGSYVPPSLPMPSAESMAPAVGEEPEEEEQRKACFAAAVSLLDGDEDEGKHAPQEEPDDGAMLRVLGIHGGGSGGGDGQPANPGPGAPACATRDAEELSEQAILDVLGLGGSVPAEGQQ